MSVHRRGDAWSVRWRDGDRNRQRTFARKRDAQAFDAETRRLGRLGTLATIDAGTETLDEYVTTTWARAHIAHLAPKTRQVYAATYDHHLAPALGTLALRAITAETIARWQTDRLAAGAGRVAVRRAFELLGSILQRAVEADRLARNPCRSVGRDVRRATWTRRDEVRPLAPATVEAMRAAASPRDAALVSVLAYAGLRPGEALALRWGDVRDRTLLVERALSLGEVKGTKTGTSRAVRLLGPLRADLAEWRLASGRPADGVLVFPSATGQPWTEPAYQSWRRRPFRRLLDAAGVTTPATPYTLRHSFASLLIHEGRSPIYAARQLGHDARLTLTTYAHVIDELEDAPSVDAEAAIRAARGESVRATFASGADGAS